MTAKAVLEDELLVHLQAVGLPEPERQVRFHPTRKWVADFGWPTCALLVEIEGGVYSGGRHVRGAGFEADCEKYAEAVLLGYRVLRFTGGQIETGYAVDCIKRALTLSEEA